MVLPMGHTGMHYSLPSRELIADSVESMALAQGFDGLVLIPNCDKIVPGMIMGAARLNIPAIVVSGGPMLAGRHNTNQSERPKAFEKLKDKFWINPQENGVKGVSLTDMFEAVGAVEAGKMSEEELDCLENNACVSCGSCSGMFTANSMNCLTEALGIALPGNLVLFLQYIPERLRLAKMTGMRIMDLVRDDIKPRDIITSESISNALTVDMALGCSTNSMLHLPAIA